MKRILTLVLSAVLLLGATVLLAQPGFHPRGGPGKGGHADFMARALDLTDEQKAAAKEIHEGVEAKAEPLMEQHASRWRRSMPSSTAPTPMPPRSGRR